MPDEKIHLTKRIPIAIYIAFALYFSLFGLAAWVYPGGSDAFPDSESYDWFHNYWCDLMGDESKNCQPNTGNVFAKIAHIISAVSLMLFSYVFPFLFERKKSIHRLITISGILMAISFGLVLTDLHNMAINFTGLFGVCVFFLAAFEILTSGMQSVFWSFLGVVLVSSFSLFVYQTSWNLYYLPFLQKIMLFSISGWMVWVTWLIQRKLNSN